MFFNPFFDILLLIFISPALLLMAWAQMRIRSTYAAADRMAAPLSGAAAARFILDQAGCSHVQVEQVGGFLSDHYDPRHKVLRLSTGVYQNRSMAAVGIAAHEAGHAIQDATRYMPLVIRNFAVPAAQYGPTAAFVLFIIGSLMRSPELIILGLIAFGAMLFFQLINLPVEFDASNRAKKILAQHNIVDAQGAVAVRSVLNAAGWTYVAVTLQSALTLLYYIFIFSGVLRGGSRDE